MVRTGSLFSQLLSLFPRREFDRAVAETASQRYAKSFSSWDHFVAMLFCQLGQAHSLREISGGLACCLGKLKHLGMSKSPSKSTLAYANEKRPWELFERVFYQLLVRCKDEAKGRTKFRFKNKLYSLDATVIDLCATVFDWARFSRTKGAAKIHLLLDHEGHIPVFANITEGRRSEIHVARSLDLAPGSIVAMDRAFFDYALFSKWTEAGVSFVTRMKRNACFEIVEARETPARSNIIMDAVIQLTSESGKRRCPQPLRVIGV